MTPKVVADADASIWHNIRNIPPLGTRVRVQRIISTPDILHNQAIERSEEMHKQQESEDLVRTTKVDREVC